MLVAIASDSDVTSMIKCEKIGLCWSRICRGQCILEKAYLINISIPFLFLSSFFSLGTFKCVRRCFDHTSPLKLTYGVRGGIIIIIQRQTVMTLLTPWMTLNTPMNTNAMVYVAYRITRWNSSRDYIVLFNVCCRLSRMMYLWPCLNLICPY